MPEPTKAELLETEPRAFDTDSLSFVGMRGDRGRHLDRAALEAALAALPPPPRDRGRVVLLVARGPAGERRLHDAALLTVDGGMPDDRWAGDDRYGPAYQLATTCAPIAALIANGQSLELHGDNLFLDLDLSIDNVPPGSVLTLGAATLLVTEQAHNGCKKWVQRFGLDAMQLNLDPGYQHRRLRGIYLQVLEPGLVRVGDEVVVVSRANG